MVVTINHGCAAYKCHFPCKMFRKRREKGIILHYSYILSMSSIKECIQEGMVRKVVGKNGMQSPKKEKKN